MVTQPYMATLFTSRAGSEEYEPHPHVGVVEVLYCNTLLLHRITGERLKIPPGFES